MSAPTRISSHVPAQGVTQPLTRLGRLGVALVAVATIILMAGCGSDEPESDPAAQSSSSSVSPLLPEEPPAADGTDLASCADATCEVDVATGDELAIDATFGVTAIAVTAVGEDEITLALRGSSGLNVSGRNVSSSGSCVNDVCSYTGELTVTTSSDGRINDIAVSLVRVTTDRAVLKLAPQ